MNKRRAAIALCGLATVILLSGCKTMEQISQELNTGLSAPGEDSGPVTIPAAFADLRPYYDRSGQCKADRKFNQHSRLLLSDTAGVVIDIDNRIMMLRHPMGTTWDKGRISGTPDQFKRRHPSGLPSYHGLSGWRTPTMEEMGILFVKCGRSGTPDRQITPIDLHGLMSSDEGSWGTRCSTRSHDEDFIFWEDTYLEEFNSDGTSRHNDHLLCSSGSSESSHRVVPTRSLSTGEVAEYERIFESGLKGNGPATPAFMHFIDGTTVQGAFDKAGNGSGYSIILKEHSFVGEQGKDTSDFYYGEFKKFRPDGRGTYLPRHGQRIDGIFANGKLVEKLPDQGCGAMNTGMAEQTRLLDIFGKWDDASGWQAEEIWLGPCRNGVPNGNGPFVIKYRLKPYEQPVQHAYLTGFITMVNGKPDGEMVASGRGQNWAGHSMIGETRIAQFSKGAVKRNYLEEARRAGQEAMNKALGAMVGWGMKKVAEAVVYCNKNPGACENTASQDAAKKMGSGSTATAKEAPASASSSSSASAKEDFSYKVISTKPFAGGTDEVKVQCSNRNYENSVYAKDGKYCDRVGALAYCVSSLDSVVRYKCTGVMK